MNIGSFKKDARGIYMGRIQTVTLDLIVGLRPISSTNPNAPRFDILARNVAGQFIAVGALWEKTASNGTGTFLQGQLNDPSFPEALPIAVFTQPDETLNVAWSRPKPRAANPFDTAAPAGADDTFAPRSDDFGMDNDFSQAPEQTSNTRRRRKAETPADDPFAGATGDFVPAN